MAAPALTLSDPTPTPVVEPAATVRLVTPEMAATWLQPEVNVGNRPLREGHVAMLAREMAEGRWQFNADPIRLSVKGRLVDGQHRLTAQLGAGLSLQHLVVTNLPDDVQSTIDTGARRTAGDILGMQGLTHANTLAAMAKLVADVDAHMNRQRMPKTAPSQVNAIIANNPTLLWVSQNELGHLPKRLGSLTVLGYCFARLHDVDPDACALFFHGLSHPYALGETSPIAALHRRLAHGKKLGTGIKDRIQLVAMIFTAWNAWRNDRPRKIAKVPQRDDGFVAVPEPV